MLGCTVWGAVTIVPAAGDQDATFANGNFAQVVTTSSLRVM